ncbi:MAG: alpha/beta fold hydrolase [Beijerinckiaceae bacterium]|nr:alpha/beta fold hydrolase [Beijerinckiaceae bacterium]
MSFTTTDLKVRHIAARQMQAGPTRSGKDETIVFLHGASGLPLWNDFFGSLAERYSLLVPEHPGFGGSSPPDDIRDIADMAMYYLDYLDRCTSGKVHLIGHSVGGWIAAEASCRNTRKIESLTLMAPAGLRIKGTPTGDNFIWSPEESVRNLVFDPALAERMLSRETSEEEADMILANRFMAAKLGWEPRWLNPALERWLHRIDVPTKIIWGANDNLFPAAYGKKWNDLIEASSLEVIDRCGHLPQVERPDESARIIISFLDGAAK